MELVVASTACGAAGFLVGLLSFKVSVMPAARHDAALPGLRVWRPVDR